jgi:hypothetical protein
MVVVRRTQVLRALGSAAGWPLLVTPPDSRGSSSRCLFNRIHAQRLYSS